MPLDAWSQVRAREEKEECGDGACADAACLYTKTIRVCRYVPRFTRRGPTLASLRAHAALYSEVVDSKCRAEGLKDFVFLLIHCRASLWWSPSLSSFVDNSGTGGFGKTPSSLRTYVAAWRTSSAFSPTRSRGGFR